jgi:hypothetical protein
VGRNSARARLHVGSFLGSVGSFLEHFFALQAGSRLLHRIHERLSTGQRSIQSHANVDYERKVYVKV